MNGYLENRPSDEDEDYNPYEEEERFYAQCAEERSRNNTSSSGLDSGYSTARRWNKANWNRPPPPRAENQPKKTTMIVIVSPEDIREDRIAVRRLKSEARWLKQRHMEEISLQQIAWHLLDFITPKYVSDHKLPRPPCIFQLRNNQIEIQERYRTRDGHVPGIYLSFNYLAANLIPTHRNLGVLDDFAKDLRRPEDDKYDKSAFVTCWLEVYDEFLNDYSRKISRLQRTCSCPLVAVHQALPLCEEVNYFAAMIYKLRRVREWNFQTLLENYFFSIETAWSLILTAISDDTMLYDGCKTIALKFQQRLYSTLLATMDSLYEHGEIPSGMKQDFVIHRERMLPGQLGCHKASSNSALWSETLLDVIMKGAIYRKFLGPRHIVDPEPFSQLFKAAIPTWDTEIVRLPHLRHIFLKTAEVLAEQFDGTLVKKVINSGLISLWQDIRNISIGTAACSFATATFNMEKITSPEMAFSRALLVGQVSKTAYWRRETIPGHTGQICCELPEELSNLFTKSFIKTLNVVLDSWLLLFRTQHILTHVIDDKKVLTNESQGDYRKFRFFVNKLNSMVVLLRCHYYKMVDQIFKDAEAKMLDIESYSQIEFLLKNAENQLNRFVDNKSDVTSKTLWEFVMVLSDTVDDVRLKSVSDGINEEVLKNWRRKLIYRFETLRSMHIHEDNLFFSLYKQIQYK